MFRYADRHGRGICESSSRCRRCGPFPGNGASETNPAGDRGAESKARALSGPRFVNFGSCKCRGGIPDATMAPESAKRGRNKCGHFRRADARVNDESRSPNRSRGRFRPQTTRRCHRRLRNLGTTSPLEETVNERKIRKTRIPMPGTSPPALRSYNGGNESVNGPAGGHSEGLFAIWAVSMGYRSRVFCAVATKPAVAIGRSPFAACWMNHSRDRKFSRGDAIVITFGVVKYIPHRRTNFVCEKITHRPTRVPTVWRLPKIDCEKKSTAP